MAGNVAILANGREIDTGRKSNVSVIVHRQQGTLSLCPHQLDGNGGSDGLLVMSHRTERWNKDDTEYQ